MTEQAAPSPPVVLTREGGVATLTFSRPEAMNALDVATKESLLQLLREVGNDPQVRCVVLTGTGRAFCVGQDLKEHIALLEEDPEQLWTTVARHYNPIVELIATMDKPVISAVNGVAAGAGAAFAFASDLRYVAASAGFNLAFTGIALSCDSGSSWSLPRLVGTAKAKELLLFPRTVRADEALELGLATEVVADEDLAGHVAQVAGRLAEGPTLAYGAVRRSVAFSAGHGLSDALAHEEEQMTRTGMTQDHQSAVAAFLAKEQPRFTGR